MSQINCFFCDGGPHLLLPRSVRSEWKGMGEDYDPTRSDTDYARACAVAPPIGLIQVGGQLALVLAGSPSLSGWANSAVDISGVDIFISGARFPISKPSIGGFNAWAFIEI